jgi:lipoprotein
MKNTNFKRRLSAVLAVMLVAVMCAGLAGCDNKKYNAGYKALHEYISENNENTDDGTKNVIQVSFTQGDSFIILTAGKKIGKTISVHVSSNGTGYIDFDIMPEGISSYYYSTIVVRTEKIGDYYYQGECSLTSVSQTSFYFPSSSLKQCTTMFGEFTEVSALLVDNLSDLLELEVQILMADLLDACDTIGIPAEMFETEIE